MTVCGLSSLRRFSGCYATVMPSTTTQHNGNVNPVSQRIPAYCVCRLTEQKYIVLLQYSLLYLEHVHVHVATISNALNEPQQGLPTTRNMAWRT